MPREKMQAKKCSLFKQMNTSVLVLIVTMHFFLYHIFMRTVHKYTIHKYTSHTGHFIGTATAEKKYCCEWESHFQIKFHGQYYLCDKDGPSSVNIIAYNYHNYHY